MDQKSNGDSDAKLKYILKAAIVMIIIALIACLGCEKGLSREDKKGGVAKPESSQNPGSAATHESTPSSESVATTGPPATPEAVNLQNKINALNIADGYASKICKDIPLKGSTNSLEFSVAGQADLSKFLKNIVNVGLEVGAGYQTSEYTNVLQEHLAPLLKANMECKRKVYNKLVGMLLVDTTGELSLKTNKKYPSITVQIIETKTSKPVYTSQLDKYPIKLVAAEYRVLVEEEGYEKFDEEVQVQGGTPRDFLITLVPHSGRIKFKQSEDFTILVDEKEYNNSTISLPVGTHTVIFFKEPGDDETFGYFNERKVPVKKDETITLEPLSERKRLPVIEIMPPVDGFTYELESNRYDDKPLGEISRDMPIQLFLLPGEYTLTKRALSDGTVYDPPHLFNLKIPTNRDSVVSIRY